MSEFPLTYRGELIDASKRIQRCVSARSTVQPLTLLYSEAHLFLDSESGLRTQVQVAPLILKRSLVASVLAIS